MSKSRRSQSGMSLIELMIGLGLLSVIGYAASHFFSRVTQSDAELSAKAKAQSELAHLTSLLEKDLKFRDIKTLTDLCPAALCKEITIDRLASGGTASYTVTYKSSCEPLPAGSKLSALQFNVSDSQCIKALNCPSGTYPSLAITVASPPAGIPAYPARTPPADLRRASYGMVGAALCATQTRTTNITTPTPHTISKDRIVLEGAYLGSNNTIRIERKETVFSSNNMAKIQMLPN